MEDTIDTSDAEEKELLEARNPGYYDTVWGTSDLLNNCDAHMKVRALSVPRSPSCIVLPNPEPQGRSYSLRHRSAKQLNPFEYDKRLYKQQLRGMPEAIVKDHNIGGRVMRRERYREEGENDWRQGDDDPGEDGDEEWGRQERRREKQKEREALDARLQELGIELVGSDGECDIPANTEAGMKGKKRKRSLKVRKFPMDTEMVSGEVSHVCRQSTPLLITSPSPTSPPLRPTSPPPSPVSPPLSPTPPPLSPASLPPSPTSPPLSPISPPRDGDLIDRMLQRTSRIVQTLTQPVFEQQSKAKGSQRPHLDIVTRDARRLGQNGGRQTKLPFRKLDKRGGLANIRKEAFPGVKRPMRKSREVHVEGQNGNVKKNKKFKRHSMQSGLFVLREDNHRIIPWRPPQIINLDDDDEALHEALAPSEAQSLTSSPILATVRPNRSGARNKKYHHHVATEQDAFDIDINTTGQRHKKILLDFDIPVLQPGMTLGADGYISKGRLFELISVLKCDTEAPKPLATTIYGLQIDPDMPVTQISPVLASACDKLYDESIATLDSLDSSTALKASVAMIHALCQFVTFKALHLNDEEGRLLVTVISEQAKRLLARIDERLELISADGHSLDSRSFYLYWFAVEVHLRLVHAHRIRSSLTEHTNTISQIAERYGIQLLRRLLEYGLDRAMNVLKGDNQSIVAPSSAVLEFWICTFHVAPFFTNTSTSGTSKPAPFWRILETAMDAQLNKPDSRLHESERIWQTTFILCAISQFSVGGLFTSSMRLEAYWPMIRKALKCIRLAADEEHDKNRPLTTLHKRDAYLRLVTARCFLLCTRWKWRLNDAEDMFHELCAIFRSRKFSNLLGEPDDFPTFIRERDEALFDIYQTSDTAFGLFLKLIIRFAKDCLEGEGTSRSRGMKLNRLLSLAVPVGSTSFTRASPPIGQALSMLYNRYSAIFVAIYVDSSATHIRSRLQQIRRYIAFKDADYDSRTAAIRSMMHIAILLRHFNKSLDDILSWASEMIDDLLAEITLNQDSIPQAERDKLILLVQLLLGSIRTIISTPNMRSSGDHAVKYPDVSLLEAWMPQLLSGPLARDHRIGLEMCKCVQSFLVARQAIVPTLLITTSKGKGDTQESQDEYGDGDLDLTDSALLEFLAGVDEPSDTNRSTDQKASEVLDKYSQHLYACVCMHLSCDSIMFGGQYFEADQWLTCWLGYGSILVRNERRDWDYYLQLGECAWQCINDLLRRIHLRVKFMLTLLQLDANVYESYKDRLLALWVESIVSPNITIENDFTARLFSADRLRHGALQNMPCAADLVTGNFAFDVSEFKRLRLPFIETIFANASKALDNDVKPEYFQLVVILLGAVRTWIQAMDWNGLIPRDYIEFGRKIFCAVRNHQTLMRDPELKELLDWSSSL